MSIEDEIEQKREEQRIKQEQLENERISRLAEAEKELAAIAETVKNKVVDEVTEGKVERRLFTKRKFVRVGTFFDADCVLRKYPELHDTLVCKLREMGMSAIRITVPSDTGPTSVYVYVEYNLK
ncbi:MAG: hypothetical protein E7617_03380 [Ruminococcaceae bacterium]|nr:hypothetical protein [Oscillospiraceae bacterium]